MIKKIILLFIFGMFIGSQQINAQTVEQKFSLDDKTVVKGYTIKLKNDNLSISVKPKAFTAKTVFVVNKYTFPEASINNQTIKSNVYQISFDRKTEKPLLVKIAWQSFSNQPKNIYWRKDPASAWQQLPSKTANKETSADIIDGGEIILLEQTPTSVEQVVKYISAKSFAVIDATNGEVLLTRNANKQQSIASLTKLMTAMVFMERPTPWTATATITKDDKDIPVTIGLKDGETVSVRDLWFATLTKSANDAAKAIARLSGLTNADFVKRMNAWAKELDLTKTSFADPSGLNPKNISTALEVAIMARAAFNYSDIVVATGSKEVKLITSTNRNLIIKNSTTLFDSDLKIVAAKTGYTTEAGRCQIIKTQGEKRNVIVVVLNSAIGQHTTDAYDLGKWFSNN